MNLDPALFNTHLEWMNQGTELFSSALSRLDLALPAGPSLLPGWLVSHLISHVNSNAQALINLTVWASTGVETPMYSSPEQRAADIEAGSKKPLRILTEDFRLSSNELLNAVLSLSHDDLAAMVKTSRGREIPAFEVVWMRVREVWIHAVDLGVGISFSDFPPVLLEAFMADVLGSFSSREGVPNLRISTSEDGEIWCAAKSEDAVSVDGQRGAVLGWLLGRTSGEGVRFGSDDGSPPELPKWL